MLIVELATRMNYISGILFRKYVVCPNLTRHLFGVFESFSVIWWLSSPHWLELLGCHGDAQSKKKKK